MIQSVLYWAQTTSTFLKKNDSSRNNLTRFCPSIFGLLQHFQTENRFIVAKQFTLKNPKVVLEALFFGKINVF
jgi:hypothetical protein